jgi:hypothetical protein
VLCCALLSASAQSDAGYTEDTVTAVVTEEDSNIVQTPPQMSEEDWQLLTKKGFPYANEREEAEADPVEEKQNGFFRFFSKISRFFSSATGKWLLWMLVAAFVLFLIWKMVLPEFLLASRRRKSQVGFTEEVPDPELTLSDKPGEQLDTFVRAGDYRNATRIAYLSVLASLSEQKLVLLRPDATDFDYYRSLPDIEVKPLFRRLLLQYQYAWYGALPVSALQWEETFSIFNQLKSKLER